MKKLTKMQQKVYDYIAQFMTKWGYPPSVREICAELNFKSPSTAHFHILNLEKKGYLEHDAGKGRAIRLKGEAQTAPAVPAAPAAPSNAVDFMEERDARENRIPIVGNVAAGSPILAQECVEDYLTFDTGSRSGEFFALRACAANLCWASASCRTIWSSSAASRPPTTGRSSSPSSGTRPRSRPSKSRTARSGSCPRTPTTSPSTGGSARCSARSLPLCASIEPETDPVY